FTNDDDREADYERMKDSCLDALKRTFRPEFLNRVDEQVVFHALNKEHIGQIITLMVTDLNKRLAENKLEIEVTPAAEAVLLAEGFDENYGARPLRRAIQRLLEDALADGVLEGRFREGDRVLADVKDEQIVLTKVE
ncbi:MAG: ATP-dependent Clp protease ATP-binding subunit ClpC, partial [Bacillota bacterium]